jgi:hypothetical protein
MNGYIKKEGCALFKVKSAPICSFLNNKKQIKFLQPTIQSIRE